MGTMVEAREKKIPLMEIFGPTIQGEGAMIGVQTYFIRFGLCDYKCTMCDSMHAVDPRQVKAHATYMTQEDIFNAFMEQYQPNTTKWITLSGGNPCIHDLTYLVARLTNEGFMVAVETQGTACPTWLLSTQLVTVCPKGPGIGEKLELDKLDAFLQRIIDGGPYTRLALKFVVFDQRDLEVAALLAERYQEVLPPSIHFYLSLGNPYPPGRDDQISQSELMAVLRLKYLELYDDIKNHPVLSTVRFLPQWHVFIWGNAKGK